MKILRITYGRGFTNPVGPPNSFQTARAYREVTLELDPEDDLDESRKLLKELVDADLNQDYTDMVGP